MSGNEVKDLNKDSLLEKPKNVSIEETSQMKGSNLSVDQEDQSEKGSLTSKTGPIINQPIDTFMNPKSDSKVHSRPLSEPRHLKKNEEEEKPKKQFQKKKVENQNENQEVENIANDDFSSSASEKGTWFKYDAIKDSSTKNSRKMKIVTILCFFFIILESIGAYYSQSIAIFSDVAHLFSDLVGFLIAWFAI